MFLSAVQLVFYAYKCRTWCIVDTLYPDNAVSRRTGCDCDDSSVHSFGAQLDTDGKAGRRVKLAQLYPIPR